ncbi:MAG: hypothetical protein Q7V53_07405 [Caldisericota bacterium]|nr:hypothetical protein [Caldisericota bacterium]
MPVSKGRPQKTGEIGITEALASLRGKHPGVLYVFAPGDEYFVPQAKEAARSQVPTTMLPFDYADFEGREDNIDAFFEFLSTPSFGDHRKVLVIDGVEDKCSKRLGPLLPLMLKSGAITVLFADPGKLPADVVAAADVVTNYKISATSTRSWIRKRFDGRQVEDRAVHELIERTGGSFFLMRNEIDRLLAWTDGPIAVADVRAVVPRSHTAAASDLVEAISLRKYDRAVFAFRDLVASGAPDTTILFDIEQGFLRLANARLISQASVRPKADLRAWCLRAQHQYLDDYTLDALLAVAGHMKLREIESMLARLETIEFETKKGLTNAVVALKQLLSEITLTKTQSVTP